jgi:hypothetical protein
MRSEKLRIMHCPTTACFPIVIGAIALAQLLSQRIGGRNECKINIERRVAAELGGNGMLISLPIRGGTQGSEGFARVLRLRCY